MKYRIYFQRFNKDVVYTKETFSDKYKVDDNVYLVDSFYGKYRVLGTMTFENYKELFNRLIPDEMYKLEKPLVLVNSKGEVALHFINLTDGLLNQEELDKLYIDKINELEGKIKNLKSKYRRLTGMKLEMKEV